MSKYKIEDLKIGAVFESMCRARTIIAVGKSEVFYSHADDNGIYREGSSAISHFRSGWYGELVKPGIEANKIKTRKGTMAWALVQLVKGLRVRHKSWDSSKYVDLAKYSDHGGWLPLITWGRNVAGWELYKEKEEKIK